MMRLVTALLLGLLLAQQPEPPSTGSGRIAGIVRDAETGAPLKDATVRVAPPNTEVSVSTDSDGRFVLNNLRPGRYYISATLAGFGPLDSSLAFPRGAYVNLAGGQRVEGIILKLAETLSLSGKIVDANGNPARSVMVTPRQKQYNSSGTETLMTVRALSGRTEDNGAYRISGLLPGEYYVMTSNLGALTYYPGVRSVNEAVPVLITKTDVTGIDFRMLPEEKHSVRFQIAGIHPIPKEINLVLQSSNAFAPTFPAQTLPTPADGWFTIPSLPPADYNLAIQWADPPENENGPATLAGRQIVSFTVVDRNLDLGLVVIQPPTMVKGKVTFKSAPPFSINIILSLTALDTRHSNWWLDSNNAYSISFVPAGRYTVGTSALPEGQFLAAATYNGIDVLGRRFAVDASSAPELDIVIDGPAGKVSGTAIDPKSSPVSNALVVMLPPADRREALDNSSVARTDQSGRFTFDRVPPGDYRLLSVTNMPENAYKNADWLKNYETRGVSITVGKGAALETTLRVIPK
jgi:hypothetical protein